ncbi:ribosomal protein L16p/L10e-domain-containing protein [Phlebopus sp. FC_14]|nr:ribosomal protein L16p/L10e-domain-containing protein [Phlebopus sp. FC_14]
MFSLSSLSASLTRLGLTRTPVFVPNGTSGARFRSQLAPRQVKYAKRQKGRVPVPIGGSTRGTTLAYGDWGIRIKGMGVRLTAKQLMTAEEAIKRHIKVIKGAKVFRRVFPDIPVCIKGNETRMGKGKGTFEFWATRAPIGRVIFEIGGTPIREEMAREGILTTYSLPLLLIDELSVLALRLAAAKLPSTYEFVDRRALPRLGSMLVEPPSQVPPTMVAGQMAEVS